MVTLTLDQVRHLQEGASLIIVHIHQGYMLGTYDKDKGLFKGVDFTSPAKVDGNKLTLGDNTFGSEWQVVEVINNLNGPSPLWDIRVRLAQGGL
jgi:hypothetical protein